MYECEQCMLMEMNGKHQHTSEKIPEFFHLLYGKRDATSRYTHVRMYDCVCDFGYFSSAFLVVYSQGII